MDGVFDSPFEGVRAKWLQEGVALNTGDPETELESFEARHGVCLPADVRAFLEVVNGFAEGEWDSQMVEWYPASRWYRLDSELPGTFFVFADYCFNGWLYAVRLGGAEGASEVIAYTGANPPLVRLAGTFAELIEAYLRNPEVMLP